MAGGCQPRPSRREGDGLDPGPVAGQAVDEPTVMGVEDRREAGRPSFNRVPRWSSLVRRRRRRIGRRGSRRRRGQGRHGRVHRGELGPEPTFQVMPLEAAEVGAAGLGQALLQEPAGGLRVVLSEGILGEADPHKHKSAVRRTGAGPRPRCGWLRPTSGRPEPSTGLRARWRRPARSGRPGSTRRADSGSRPRRPSSRASPRPARRQHPAQGRDQRIARAHRQYRSAVLIWRARIGSSARNRRKSSAHRVGRGVPRFRVLLDGLEHDGFEIEGDRGSIERGRGGSTFLTRSIRARRLGESNAGRRRSSS